MAKADRRAHDGQVVFVRRQLADERAVDLQLVYRQSLQVRQRRVASAEVVDRDADAHQAQRGDGVQRPSRVGHQTVFGDLDHEL